MSRFNTQTRAEVPVLEPAGDVLDNRNKVTSPSPHQGGPHVIFSSYVSESCKVSN